MRAKEFTPGSQDLVIFDIDDTLMHTTAKIKVVKDGQVIRDLTNQEFNNYQLQPGEEFDFGEFRSAEKFRQESKPIAPMVRKLKAILSHAGNAKVIMLTARADFDNKDTFLQTFHDLGIDMSRVHVHRAGNLPGDDPPAYKKAVWVRKYLDTKQYGHVRLYDDSMSNLRVFKELKKEYPQVDFRAIYVGPGGTTQTVEALDKPTPSPATIARKFNVTVDYVTQQLQKGIEAETEHTSNLDQAKEIALDHLAERPDYYQRLARAGLEENFADGKNPQDKGDSKRYNVPTKASVSTLRKVAKQGGRKGQLAHWMANMKAGKAKKK
jgi:FMN phosphatase YigB (HAD superfamily)